MASYPDDLLYTQDHEWIRIDGDRGSRLEIAFQNEWVVAWRDGDPLAMSPDLICVLDSETGNAFGRRQITIGSRVGDRYEVTAGLKAGERIISEGALFVQFAQTQ